MDAVVDYIGPMMPLASSTLGPLARSTIIATDNSNVVVCTSSFWDILRRSKGGSDDKRRVGVGLLGGNSLLSLDGSNR